MSEKYMSFLNHLIEFRQKLFICLGFVVLFSVVSYYLYFPITDFLTAPLEENLYARRITEGFLTRLQVSVLAGVLFSFPVIILQLLLFVFPALKGKQKKLIIPGVILTGILFIAGIMFAYNMIIPLTVKFLKSSAFFPSGVYRQFIYRDTVKFIFQFLLAFGVAFQLPVVLLILMWAGVLKRQYLIKNFRVVVVLCFVISAFITPPDVISQVLLALPLVGLYGISILLGSALRIGGA